MLKKKTAGAKNFAPAAFFQRKIYLQVVNVLYGELVNIFASTRVASVWVFPAEKAIICSFSCFWKSRSS